jgi:hypothetical protein
VSALKPSKGAGEVYASKEVSSGLFVTGFAGQFGYAAVYIFAAASSLLGQRLSSPPAALDPDH